MFGSGEEFQTSQGASAVSLIDAVFRWCKALKGEDTIESALAAIAKGVGAEAMTLSRVRHGSFQAAKCVTYDTLSSASPKPRLTRSFAASILSEFMSIARSGTVWLRSVVEVETDPALDLFHSRRKLQELVVIPLQTDHGFSDFVEFHFLDPLSRNQHALLNMLAETLSEAWRNRSHGVFAACALEDKRQERDFDSVDLLGHENPARLSRAEYRVCLLLSRGLPNKGICEELSISNATLRTHLRNVYAKTSTDGMPDLLYLLLKGPRQRPQGDLRRIA
ncbi:helix-turn-helix transcriptional regulator [Tropicimonas sediminicola]|uniref:Transcriptional regulator, LuxR family n=1 Tax=Tropicimonas sediminicola TaxID=1031541 RepID=A0A239EJW0_9RHOB|nr:helix-turn-helix transcriptional regulator [Tropicimonas sediminicola]SNS45060.1 transcriptional regulator, LuxR family [Tropicimonas sediminicola]